MLFGWLLAGVRRGTHNSDIWPKLRKDSTGLFPSFFICITHIFRFLSSRPFPLLGREDGAAIRLAKELFLPHPSQGVFTQSSLLPRSFCLGTVFSELLNISVPNISFFSGPPPLFLDEDDALWNKKVAGSCLMGLLSIMAGSTRAEPARFQDGHRRPSHWVVNSIRAGILSLLLACGTPGPSTLLASQRHLPSVAEWMAHSLTDQLNEAMSLLSVLMTLLHSVAWFSSLPQPLFLFLPLLSFGGLFFFFFSAQLLLKLLHYRFFWCYIPWYLAL